MTYDLLNAKQAYIKGSKIYYALRYLMNNVDFIFYLGGWIGRYLLPMPTV